MRIQDVPVDLNLVLKHSIRASQIAGEISVQNFGKLKSDEIHTKSAFDFVTEVDKTSEAAIIKHLQKYFPDFAVHAEESGECYGNSQFKWFIDPLDGTKNYIHKFPIFSISIGLQYKNEIVCAVVYAPKLGETFTAVKGQGAYLNDKLIKVSNISNMAHSMLATGFPHSAKDYLDVYLKSFKELFLKVSAIRRAGSAAIDLAYTACGRFDGLWEFKLNPWDICAGILLIQEAGGVVSDPIGRNNFFQTGDIVAGNSEIQKKLIKTLSSICEGNLGW